MTEIALIKDLNEPPWKKKPEAISRTPEDFSSPDKEMTDEMARRLKDPLCDLAFRFRDMPAHNLRAFCRGLHNPGLQDTLIDWALAYIKGEEIPPPEKTERRF